MAFRDFVVWHKALLPPLELPERFAAAWPGGIENAEVRAAVESYLNNFWDAAEQGIAPLLAGRAGQWKTYGAAVVARFAHWQRVPTRFVQCGPTFSRADALFFEQEGTLSLQTLVETPFLVLDDFTQVLHSGRAADLMANVMAERFAKQLPTLLTGNINLTTTKEFQKAAERWRPDFLRRIWHGSAGYRATLNG